MLVFTDAQIQSLTQEMYDYAAMLLALNTNLAAVTAAQSGLLTKDDANAVYTSNFISILSSYHTELKYISGTERTTYDSAQIDIAGRLAPNNIHFPSPFLVWVYLEPKVHASNLGNPTSTWVNTENSAIQGAQINLDLLKNGWNYPPAAAMTSSNTGFYSGDLISVISNAGFAVNDKVLLTDGSDYLYGWVTQVIGFTVLRISITVASNGYTGIGSGATVQNYFQGFSFSELESGVGANPALSAFMVGLKSFVDNAVANWETYILAVQAAITANSAVGALYTQNQAALALVNGHINDINTWQGYPSIGIGTSRFGTNLPAFESSMSARQTEFSPRSSQISTALGSISQPGTSNGTYTGSGQYYELFKNLDQRLNKISGSLRAYYDSELGITAINQQIAVLNAQYARDSVTFNMKKFTADGSGTNTISVDSVSGLAISDTVKIISSTQPILTATISGISGLNVTLSVTVSSAYKVAESARLVKQN